MGFVDIHSHILPGLDDGPGTMDESIQAARAYADIGVERVIATPHCIQGSRWAPKPAEILRSVEEMQQRIQGAGIPVQLFPGMEIAVNDLIDGRFTDERFMPLGDTGTFLVEFPLNAPSRSFSMHDLVKLLAARGSTRYVVAHPERCPVFQDNIEAVKTLLAAGMLIQVNIASVLGRHGKKARETVFHLLTTGRVHFLATDTHGRPGRMPPEPAEMDQLNHILGTETVDQGFRANPLRLLNGEEILPLRTEPKQPPVFTAGVIIQRLRRIFTENSLD